MSAAFDLFTSTANWFVLAYGLALYSLILPPLIKFRNAPTLRNPFFRLCLSMAFFDMWGIFTKIFLPILELMFEEFSWMSGLYGYLSYVPWWGVQLHQFVIALDRMVVISFPMGRQEQLFGDSKLTVALVAMWSISLGGNVHMFTKFGFVLKSSNDSSNGYKFDLTDPQVQLVVLIRDVILQGLIYTAIVVFYLVGWSQLRAMKTRDNQAGQDVRCKAERSMLIQGMLLTAPQAVTVVSYFIAVLIPQAPHQVLMALVGVGNTLYNCINPAVYLAFSSELRKKVIEFYLPNYKVAQNVKNTNRLSANRSLQP